jgi:hypothetical protein
MHLKGSENMNTAVPAQPSAPEARRKGTSKRLKNFSTKEDESLCSAYINVSKDPIVGTNQPIRSYWGRIKASKIVNVPGPSLPCSIGGLISRMILQDFVGFTLRLNGKTRVARAMVTR